MHLNVAVQEGRETKAILQSMMPIKKGQAIRLGSVGLGSYGKLTNSTARITAEYTQDNIAMASCHMLVEIDEFR
jgi:hypothetical protein